MRAGDAPARSSGSSAASARTIALPVECTLSDAETLKLRLAAQLKSAKPVTVDVSLVHRIDTASLQLLAAFAHERRASRLDFAISGGSRVFAQAARLLGLGALLDPETNAPERCDA
jgi:anti-anti-sigma regulatory factor